MGLAARRLISANFQPGGNVRLGSWSRHLEEVGLESDCFLTRLWLGPYVVLCCLTGSMIERRPRRGLGMSGDNGSYCKINGKK